MRNPQPSATQACSSYLRRDYCEKELAEKAWLTFQGVHEVSGLTVNLQTNYSHVQIRSTIGEIGATNSQPSHIESTSEVSRQIIWITKNL